MLRADKLAIMAGETGRGPRVSSIVVDGAKHDSREDCSRLLAC